MNLNINVVVNYITKATMRQGSGRGLRKPVGDIERSRKRSLTGFSACAALADRAVTVSQL